MKKIMGVLAVAAMIFAGCNKEQDLSGYVTQEQLSQMHMTQAYSFNVNFPAIENEYWSEATYNGLVGKVKKDDILLVYCYLGGWCQLPYCFENLALVYTRADNGSLTFQYGRANYVQITQEAQTLQMRAIVLPQSVFSQLKSNGVNTGSYDAVIDACRALEVSER